MPSHLDSASQLPTAPPDFAAVFQAAPVGLLVLDRALRYVACNETLSGINGIPAEKHLGKSVRELLPDLAPEVEPRFLAVFETGRATSNVKVVGSTPRAPGLRRTFLENVTPIRRPDGQVEHILVSVQEITALEEAEGALRERERVLRVSQQLSGDGFLIVRAVRDAGAVVDFVYEYANPAAEKALRSGQLAGRTLLEAFPESRDHPSLFPRYVRLLGGKEPEEVEIEFDRDGASGLFRNCAVAIDDQRLAVSIQDLSAHRRTEEQLRLVGGELQHRVKNLISVVRGLVLLSAKSAGDVAGYCKVLLERLSALGAAQDLLSRSGDTGVTLGDVVAAVLAPFGSPRLQTGPGPAVAVPGSAVSPLTLALNELATNAIKHGALGAAEGTASLSWSVTDGRVELAWSEQGGPPAAPPTRRGFGSRVIKEAVGRLPNGTLNQASGAGGLEVVIAFDAPSNADRIENHPAAGRPPMTASNG